MTNASFIYHIASEADVSQAKTDGRYKCDSLASEGFIHCCTKSQLDGVIERYYTGVSNLILLTIDPVLLNEPLCYENTVGGTENFPHLYGALNLEAILKEESLH
jgi:uncharacterized protein (DUF952 family)